MRQGLGYGDVAHLLSRRMPELVVALGLKGSRQGAEFTPLNPRRADRSTGSFSINLNTGRWSEFATGDAGDALGLVSYVAFKDDVREAFRWAKRWLGQPDNPEYLRGGTQKLEKAAQDADAYAAQARAELAAELDRKRRSAFAMWLEAKALVPTSPAWRYLEDVRAIPLASLARMPSAVKASAASRHVETDKIVPALVSAMFLPAGGLAAVHRVFLEPGGMGKYIGRPNRKIFPGGYQGAFIPISRGASDLPIAKAFERGVRDTVCYAEGVEDALTAAVLAPEWRVYAVGAALNFAHQEPPACAARVVVLRDNDPDPDVRKSVGRWVGALRARCQERELPFGESKATGGAKDFNDMVTG